MIQIDLTELLDKIEPTLRRRYQEIMDRLRQRNRLDEVQRLVDQGRWEEAITGLDEAAEELSAEFRVAFLLVAKALADALRPGSPRGFAFDATHWRVISLFQDVETILVGLFRRDLRTLADRARRDPAARETLAADMVASLGLGIDQIEALRRYRSTLGQSERERQRAQQREVTPRRPLTAAATIRMIAAMVRRLRAGQVERVGLWLGQYATQQAADIVLKMAVEFGALAGDSIMRTWWTRADHLVRDTHDPMHGQQRPLGRPFSTGSGFAIRFPGDPAAPLKETRGCRCGLLIELR